MKENLFDIKDKVVVMTGACGVLGGTIVKYLSGHASKRAKGFWIWNVHLR